MPTTQTRFRRRRDWRLNALAAALCAAGCFSPLVQAAPTGGVVRAGDARIEQQGNLTRIEQTSARAIIDWRGFDVGAAEAVRFDQPSSRSATLNRVTGDQLSRIDGRISADGQVFLVNPNGVIFGDGASIDVGSLFVSTANIANPDFMAGRLKFDQPGRPDASIRNAGTITAAEGGLVALVAPHVRNDGVIAARLGKVALAGGDRFTLDLYGDQLIRLEIGEADARALLEAQPGRVDQSGRIEADGGQVVLVTAATGKRALDGVINLDGIAQADSVREQGGRIVLESAGEVRVSGELRARGLGEGEVGGVIDVRGERITLAGARVDSSGQAGGGRVHVGGGWQGGEGRRAREVDVDTGSRLHADALGRGDGGEVVVWADGRTGYAGTITARGGEQGGDGGRVEVSGLVRLDFAGHVDAGANLGLGGLLLLDPDNLLIGPAEAAVIARILRTGTTTRLQANEDIEINAAIDGRGGRAGGGLDLEAGRDIRINDYIVTRDGRVRLYAGTGTVTVAPDKAVFAGGGGIDIVTGGSLDAGALLTSGALSLTSTGGAVRVGAPIEAGNGDLVVRAATDVDIDAPVVNLRSGAKVDIEAGGDLRVSAQIDGLDGVSGGSARLVAGGDLTLSSWVATQDGAVTGQSGGRIVVGADGGVLAGNAPVSLDAGEDLELHGIVHSLGAVALRSRDAGVVLGAPFLADSGALTVTAGLDVSVDAPVLTPRSGAPVHIEAGRDLRVNAQIDGLGDQTSGSVTLKAGRDLIGNASVATRDGAIDVRAGGQVWLSPETGLHAGSAPITVRGVSVRTGMLDTSGALDVQATGGDLVIGGAMLLGTTTQIQTSGNLDIQQPIVMADGASLTLSAELDLGVRAFLRVSGVGAIHLAGGRDVHLDAPVFSDFGAISVTAGRDVTAGSNGGLYAGSGPVGIDANRNLTAPVVMTGGPITLTSATGSVDLAGQVRGAGAPVAISAPGAITIGQPVVIGNGGSLNLNAGGNLTVNAQLRGGVASRIEADAGGAIQVNDDIAVDSGWIRLFAGNELGFSLGGGAYAGAGGIHLYAGGNLTTGNLSAAGGASLTSDGALRVARPIGADVGALDLYAAGSLWIDAPIANVGGGLSARSGGDLFVNAQIDGIGTFLSLDAGGSLYVDDEVASANAPLQARAGGSVHQTANGVDEYGAPLTRQLRSGDAPLTVIAGGNLTTGSMVTTSTLDVISTGGHIHIATPIYETTGDTRILAAGDIRVNQVVANNTSGADLFMQAGGNIHVDAKIGPWDRSDATYPTLNRDATPGGRITLISAGDLLINQEIATYLDTLTGIDDAAISLTSTAGGVHLAPNLKVVSDGGAISVRSHADLENGPAITVFDVAHLNAAPTTGYFTTGALSLTSTGGDVHINQIIPNTTGSVTIRAADGLYINQRIYTADGDINLYAGAGGIWQNPMADPEPDANLNTTRISDIDPARGNLYMEAVGDIRPQVVRADGTLTIKSTAGAIIGGEIGSSRDSAAVNLGMPSSVRLAGYTGIHGFNTTSSSDVAAISSVGSVTGLGVYQPGNLLIIAGQDIVNPSASLGHAARLYAGRDITLSGFVAIDFEARAGGDFTVTGNALANDGPTYFYNLAGSMDVSAGTDPFTGLGGVTVAGVNAPTWGGATPGGGDITFNTSGGNRVLWVSGDGGMIANATGNITLPITHVSYALDFINHDFWASTLSQHITQPFDLHAGGDISLQRLQTVGVVSMVSTGGDIQIDHTIGAHVTVDPTQGWNPDDLGVASLYLRADQGDIRMHEARAEGDITIAAPNGTVSFLGGLNGIEAGGNRSVTDSGGAVVVGASIDATPVNRIPGPIAVAPAVAVGPTLAGGPGGPVPGALPPGAPAAPLFANAGPGATPGAPTPSGAGTGPVGPTGATVSAGTPGAIGAGATTTPGGLATGADSFGEIFVADSAAEQPARSSEQTGTETAEAAEGGASAEETQLADSSSAEERGEGAAVLAAIEEDDEERRKRESGAAPLDAAYLAFAGGRGDAREKDFGRGDPVELNRVRP